MQQHDYEKFYEFELAMRKQFFYPPYSRLVRIVIKHRIKEMAFEAAEVLAKSLSNDFENLVGPAAPIVNRVRNMYLMEILIKLQKDAIQLQAKRKQSGIT